MADLDDILGTLVTLITGVIYPSGIDHSSVTGGAVKIYEGWPIPSILESDLAAGSSHISVFPQQVERNTTRRPVAFEEAFIPAATLTAVVASNTVTIGGTISLPQAVMVIANDIAYSYQLRSGDTLASIAASLALLIPHAVADSATITISGLYRLNAMIIVNGIACKETRRQERVIQVTVWAPTPTARTTIVKAVDPYLGALERFTLNDYTSARLTYRGSPITDNLQKATIYRRDLLYTVEYPTITQQTFTTIGKISTSVTREGA